LDVAQIHIKINQTTQSNGGKPKSTTQTYAPANSFDQILTMYNFLSHSSELEGQSVPPTIQNVSVKLDSIQAEPTNISEEDWLELESILAALLAEIQQGQQAHLTPQQSLGNSYSANSPLPLPILSLPQEATSDSYKELGQWLQKVEGLNQTLSLDQSQLMQRLTQLIDKIQSIMIQNPVDVPDGMGDKIQMILDESKTTNKFAVRTPFNSQSHENVLLFDDKKQAVTRGLTPLDEQSVVSSVQNVTEKPSSTIEVPNEIGDKIQILLDVSKTENKFAVRQLHNNPTHDNVLLLDDIKLDVSLESKPQLILDKNQVIFLANSLPGMSIDEETRFARVPFTKEGEVQTILNGIPLMVNQQQGPDGSNVSKAISPPPILSVSEFVPEVSEWIGRYSRITNGQPGGAEAKLSLYPEHLGHIEIKITSLHGQLSAQIVTDTLMAKEALEGQLSQLRQALQEHGLLVKKLDIVQQTPVSIDSSQANLSFSQGGTNSSHEQRTFTRAQDVSKNQKDVDETGKEIETVSITYGGAAHKKVSSIDFTA
jgi:flagellar hook-length control protein FliK